MADLGLVYAESRMLPAALALSAMLSPSDYDEPLRPQFHFTARKGWLNDPNGLAYFGGEYHLFFQHNPFGPQWGNMTWGHAASRDLVHWRQVENALEPDALGTMFSGSAVVDTRNTSGLGQKGKPALVCFYTAAGGTNEASKGQPFTQCLAYSLDGRAFTKLAGNPILSHIEAENRDPKVIWHEPTARWVMALYLNEDRYALFGSSNLKEWKKLSDVKMPGTSECPDFFPLAVDGDRSKSKWVFWGGNGRYRVGSFDGTTFHPESEPVSSNFGNTGYAAQTYFNDPKGRRVQIAWHNNANFPGTAWNQQMGVPTELKLVSTPNGPRLTLWPVRELERLRLPRVSGGAEFKVDSGLMDVIIEARVPPAGELVIMANGHRLACDAAAGALKFLDRTVAIAPIKGKLRLRLLVDRASIEVFAQDGRISAPFFVLPKEAPRGFRVEASEGWKLTKLEVFPMRSAWEATLGRGH